MGTMEKAGIAVVGVLIVIIIVVGLINRDDGTTDSNSKNAGGTQVASEDHRNDSEDREQLNRSLDPSAKKKAEELEEARLKLERESLAAGKKKPGEDPTGPGGASIDFNPQPEKPAIAGPGPGSAGKKPVVGTAKLIKHKIAPNENMSSLAKKYYGDAGLYWVIQRANPDVNPRTLRGGDVINVPSKDEVAALRSKKTPRTGGVVRDGGAGKKNGEKPATLVSKKRRPSFIPPSYIDTYVKGKPSSSSKPAKGGESVDASGLRTWTVKSGDSLGSIAQKTLGSARHAGAIYKANKQLIKNPDSLQAGWVLTIPTID